MPKTLLIAFFVLIFGAVIAFVYDQLSTLGRIGRTVDCKVTYLEVHLSRGVRYQGNPLIRSVSNVEMSCDGRNYTFARYKNVRGLDYAQWSALELGQPLKADLAQPSFSAKLLGMDSVPGLARLRAP